MDDEPSSNNAPAGERIGLALSGGGFRATLFHLGVLLYFRNSGLIRNVTHVCSVSGGSVVAAYVVSKWDTFLHPTGYIDVVKKLVEFTKSDLIGKIYRGVRSRTARLEKYYDRDLFEGATRSSLYGTSAPKLYMIATDLTTGGPVAFCTGGLCRGRPSDANTAQEATFSLARAVAASSAFPLVFREIRLDPSAYGVPGGHSVYLTDGGVRDNSGLEFLHDLHRQERVFDRLVGSDARRHFDYSTAGEEGLIKLPAVLERSFDIATEELDDFRQKHVRAAPICLTDVRLTDVPSQSSAMTYEVAPLLGFVRTDFDVFTDAEIVALVEHGYITAMQAMRGQGAAVAATTGLDWKKILGREPPHLSPEAFRDSHRRRILRHFKGPLTSAALIAIAAVVALWPGAPTLPTYNPGMSRLVDADQIREQWMNALVNDLEREAGCDPYVRQRKPCVSSMLIVSPFTRGTAPGALVGTYDEQRFSVGAFAFQRAQDQVAYVPLTKARSNGRLVVNYEVARAGDELVVFLVVSPNAGSKPPMGVQEVFRDWRFEWPR